MNNKILDEIKNLIAKCDGYDIADGQVEEQKFIKFELALAQTTSIIYLFYNDSDDESIFRIFTTFRVPYQEPETDFYLIISKLNIASVWGGLVVGKENDGNYYISYKSNVILKTKDILDKDNFNLFLKASIAMINMCHNELNLR